MKKYILSTALCLLWATSAFAAPQITEVRLTDDPGYDPDGHLQTELVFRSDNSLYWIKGAGKNVVRDRYTLKPGEFQKLAQSFNTYGFFGLKSNHPLGRISVDVPHFVLAASREGQKQEVTYVSTSHTGSQPLNVWTLEKIVRGVAMATIHPEPIEHKTG